MKYCAHNKLPELIPAGNFLAGTLKLLSFIINTAINRGVNDGNQKNFNRFICPSSGGTAYHHLSNNLDYILFVNLFIQNKF